MDEEEVIRDILAGNVNRYAEIVKAYQTIVANLCFKMGGNRVDIPEMTQQVFVELYMALPRFQFKSKLSTFIYRITVNVVCKELKHNSRWLTSQDAARPPRGGNRRPQCRAVHHPRRASSGRCTKPSAAFMPNNAPPWCSILSTTSPTTTSLT